MPRFGNGPERSEKSTSKNPPSGSLYTEMSYGALLPDGGPVDTFYIDLGASDHLISSQGELPAHGKFASPVEISAADSGEMYADGTGTLRVAAWSGGPLLSTPEPMGNFCRLGS